MKQALFIHHASARRFKLLPAQAASHRGGDGIHIITIDRATQDVAIGVMRQE